MVSTYPLISKFSSLFTNLWNDSFWVHKNMERFTNLRIIIIIIILFRFQLYFRYITTLHRVFTQDLGWGKIEIICIYIPSILFGVTFPVRLDSSKEMSDSAKCNSSYFTQVATTRYLVKMFICCCFLNLTQYSQYYWHGVSFKWPHFFQFLFPALCIYFFFILLFDWCVIICLHWHIN